MNFGFSEEQDLLRKEVRRFLDERSSLAEVRSVSETALGYDEKLWQELADLGWRGLTVPEAHGGAGLGWVDLIVLFEEMGRSLFPSPFLANTLAATAIVELGSDAQHQRWLPSIVNGTSIGTVALLEETDLASPEGTQLRGTKDGSGFTLSGQKRFVADPEAANLYVVSFRTGDGDDDLAADEGVAELLGRRRRRRWGSATFRRRSATFQRRRAGPVPDPYPRAGVEHEAVALVH